MHRRNALKLFHIPMVWPVSLLLIVFPVTEKGNCWEMLGSSDAVDIMWKLNGSRVLKCQIPVCFEGMTWFNPGFQLKGLTGIMHETEKKMRTILGHASSGMD